MAKTTAAELVRARATSEEITAERNRAEYGERSMFVAPYEHAARVLRELAAQIDALPAEPVGLPVIATCGMCSQFAKDCGEYHCGALAPLAGETGFDYYDRTATSAEATPPAWCPLRSKP